jgi:hypothetical protein
MSEVVGERFFRDNRSFRLHNFGGSLPWAGGEAGDSELDQGQR